MHAHVDGRAGRDRVALDLGVGRGDAAEVEQRWFPPQALLDRTRDERGVAPERIELIGMRQQRVQQVGEHPVGRLRAGRHEQPEEGHDLVVVESVARAVGLGDLGFDQDADEVVARFGAAIVDDGLHELSEVRAGREPALG